MKRHTRPIKLEHDDKKHNHIMFMYGNETERLQLLADYYREGLENHELCIFVTPGTPEKALEDFLDVEFDAHEAYDKGDLRIFEMNSAYMPQGKFSSNGMLLNVVNFIIDAKSNGYSGIRTAGEMAWLYDNAEFLTAAARYETQVNGLNAASPEFTGMCLYPVREGVGDILDAALETHPDFVYNGAIQSNPLFKTTAAA